jgi:hypothetical protein
MIFKDNYTTASLKASISADKDKTPEYKEAENKKIEVSNDAFLNAEMIDALIKQIELSRITSLNMRR